MTPLQALKIVAKALKEAGHSEDFILHLIIDLYLGRPSTDLDTVSSMVRALFKADHDYCCECGFDRGPSGSSNCPNCNC